MLKSTVYNRQLQMLPTVTNRQLQTGLNKCQVQGRKRRTTILYADGFILYVNGYSVSVGPIWMRTQSLEGVGGGPLQQKRIE